MLINWLILTQTGITLHKLDYIMHYAHAHLSRIPIVWSNTRVQRKHPHEHLLTFFTCSLMCSLERHVSVSTFGSKRFRCVFTVRMSHKARISPVFKLWDNQQALPFNAAWLDPSSVHIFALKLCFQQYCLALACPLFLSTTVRQTD